MSDKPMYGVSASGELTQIGEYDPKITEEIDSQIRNMPVVVDHCFKKALELLHHTGSDNFEVVLSTEHGAEIYGAHSGATPSRRLSRKVILGSLFGAKSASSGGAGTTEREHEHQRPRAYVAPANNKGIHEELSQAVLLKAALGMAGK